MNERRPRLPPPPKFPLPSPGFPIDAASSFLSTDTALDQR
ncbi:hypothetical protein [Azospirillum endophyticum]